MFTENQQKALAFNCHVSVTANAGSGKTTVLVQRFIEILLRTDAQVKELVAITFTEKAASELRKKIATEIENRIQVSLSAKERTRFQEIRDHLNSANVGTIHSFCAQLLREYPVEADVDAAFTVLEGIDQRGLEQEALRETFASFLQEGSSKDQRDGVLDLIRMLGKKTVEQYLSIFLSRREHVERLISPTGCLLPQRSDDELCRRWNARVMELVSGGVRQKGWKDSLQKVLCVARGKSAPQVQLLVQSLANVSSDEEMIKIYHEISQLVLTKDGTLRKNFIGSGVGTDTLNEEIGELASQYDSLSSLIESLLDPEAQLGQRTLARSLRVLISMYRKAMELYDEKKSEYGQLDFEDLQLKVRGLLAQEEICRKLSERFRFIMVDEFQDTNRLQYEILQLLMQHWQKGNLFIVGDPKQSIYGFRDAEVEVFDEMKRCIRESWSGGEITLAESFRLLPNVTDFVNRVFSKLMSRRVSRYEVGYEEIVQARSQHGEGVVELMLVPDAASTDLTDEDEIPTDQGSTVAECRMIAQRISDLVRTKHLFFPLDGGAPRPFQYCDAAILIRSRSNISVLEQVLSERHIPYIISGGIGFYQTQEVFDFLNYCTFLLSPDADTSLAGILRSPFFAVSDADLFEVSLIGGDSLWKKIVHLAAGEKAGKRIRRAVAILSSHLDLANRVSIPMLVQQICLDTGWRGTIAGLPSGSQRAANIQKLIRLAREFEAKGYLTLYDFVRRLRSLARDEEREGQESIEEAGQGVQIMTIHAAKGLEFPVVFVPFTHQRFHYDVQPFFDPEYGVAFSVRNSNDLDRVVIPPIYEVLRQQSRQKTEAEEKRIFYVACTRARDMLVLSGQLHGKGNHPSYLRWVSGSLEINFSGEIPSSFSLPPLPMKILALNNGIPGIQEIQHATEIKVRSPNDQIGCRVDLNKSVTEILTPERIATEALQGQSRREYYSATQLKAYMECPAKYYFKYRLGLPEMQTLPPHFDEDDEANDALRGELEGELTHAVLENIDRNTFTANELDVWIEKVFAVGVGTGSRVESTKEIVKRNVMRFVESKIGREVLASAESYTEYSLSAIFDRDYVTGTIDRLYRNELGQWSILDYKTDTISLEETSKMAGVYKPQLLLYALLVSKYFRQEMVTASIIFLKHPAASVSWEFASEELSAFEEVVRRTISSMKKERYDTLISSCDRCPYNIDGACLSGVKRHSLDRLKSHPISYPQE